MCVYNIGVIKCVCVHTHIIPGPHCGSRICLMPKHGYPSDLFFSLVRARMPHTLTLSAYTACRIVSAVQRQSSSRPYAVRRGRRANISKIPTTHPKKPAARCSCRLVASTAAAMTRLENPIYTSYYNNIILYLYTHYLVYGRDSRVLYLRLGLIEIYASRIRF